MKRINLFLSAAALFAAMSVPAVRAQVPSHPLFEGFQSVGPVVSGSVDVSSLPDKAREFIRKHFRELEVVKCSEDYADRSYEVALSDGTDIEFDSKGEWTEVDAGDSRLLSKDMVRHLLPDRAYRELEHRSVIHKVETVKRGQKGYKVELRDVDLDDYRFSTDGKLLSVND